MNQTAAAIGHNKSPSTADILKEKHAPIFERAKRVLAKLKRADLDPKTIEDCAKLEDLFGEARDVANDADAIRTSEKEEPLKVCKEIDALFNGEVRDTLGTDPKMGGLARRVLQAAADRRLAITREEQRRREAEATRLRQEADKLEAQAKTQEEAGKTKQADVTLAKVDDLDRAADAAQAAAAAPVEEASRARTASGRSVAVGAKLVCTGVVRTELDLEALRPYFKQDALVDAVNAALKMGAFTELKGAGIIEQATGRVR
jgi:hypothetical protein